MVGAITKAFFSRMATRFNTILNLRCGVVLKSTWVQLLLTLCVVGAGEKIHFWIDNWLGNRLVDMLHVAPTSKHI
jgi:hypothetical protein